MTLDTHIARLDHETALAQALLDEQRAEQRYQATRTVAAAVDLHIARYRAAQEEER